MPLAVILVFGALGLLWLYNKLSRPKNYPPGPFLFPIVGALPQLGFGGFLESLEKWKNQYGNIFSLNIGSTRVVVLNDYEVIKEAYALDVFAGRPSNPQLRVIGGEQRRGISASDGPNWEAQRRFALRQLRDFGFGKKSLETETQQDIVDLMAKFKEVKGQPVSTEFTFNMSVVGALWRMVSGQRYDLDDPAFQHIMEKLETAVNTATGSRTASLSSMEWLIKLAPNWTGWSEFKNGIAEAKAFIREQIDEHKKSHQEGSSRDFMDVFITEMNQTKDPNSSFFQKTGYENLQTASLNLLGGGSETTSSTLGWALFFLTQNEKIQKKLQAEIDSVIGRSRLPSLADQDSMPYASATILEILRKSSLVPTSVPHCTVADVKFRGFLIPKNTTIMANTYDLHHDKKIWGDPEVFRPERFLTSDEKSVVKGHPPLVAFGIGKRQCIGETLARNNLFLFLVSIFQTFDIKLPSNSPKEFKMSGGIFRVPPKIKVIFEERQEK